MQKIEIEKISISDMRDKCLEIEEYILKENKTIYLTKKGRDSMVILSIENYKQLLNNAKYNEYIEKALDEAEEEAKNPNTKYYTHNEVFEKIRTNLNG